MALRQLFHSNHTEMMSTKCVTSDMNLQLHVSSATGSLQLLRPQLSLVTSLSRVEYHEQPATARMRQAESAGFD